MPTDSYKPDAEEEAAIELVRRSVEHCEREWHDEFVRKVERRYEAYRAMKQKKSEAESQGWRSAVFQPLLINIVEGMLASTVEPEPAWQVTPRPRPGEALDSVEERMLAADIAEAKLGADMQRDRFARKQRPFMQQDLIAGFSVLKTRRRRDKGTLRYLSPKTELEFDQQSGSVDVVDYEAKEEEQVVLRDGPSCEVRDVRDWFVPGFVTELESAPYVIDRVWMTMDQLRKAQQQGLYSNVEYLDVREAPNQPVAGREMTLYNIYRTKGLVEVLEFWNANDVFTVANRKVLLKSARNSVFWHGNYPFIVTSALPEMFSIRGISVIEGLAQMQDMLWTLQNTRLDTVRMMANLITLVRADAENADEFEWAPLARWVVSDPNQVKTLDIDPAVANITLQAEQLLRGDVQQLMGGLPFSSGASSSVVDQTTATGVSIITNIAQQILAARKQQYLWAFEELGRQFLSIAQQSMRDTEVVPQPTADGLSFLEVNPLSIQGEFDVKLRMAAESMIRREERAEWQSLLTVALQGSAPSAQMGVMINIKELWKQLFRAYDIPNPDAYVSDLPQQGGMPGAPAAPGGMGSPPAPPEGASPNGATNTDLAAMGGQTAPTGPEQQMMARSGGGV